MDSCLKHLPLRSPAPLLQAIVEKRGKFIPYFLMCNFILSKMGVVCQSKFVFMSENFKRWIKIKWLTNNCERHKMDSNPNRKTLVRQGPVPCEREKHAPTQIGEYRINRF